MSGVHFKGLFVRRSKLERGAGAPGLSVKAHGAVAPTGVILTENCISIGSLQNYQERKAEASEMGDKQSSHPRLAQGDVS